MSVLNSRSGAFPAALRLKVAREPRLRVPLAVALAVAAALAIAFLPPLVAFWLVFGVAAIALILVTPVAGLYLLPFAVGFGSLISLSVHGINVGPTDLLVAALALAVGTRIAGEQRSSSLGFAQSAQRFVHCLRSAARREPLLAALYAALLAYLAVVTLSLLVATDRVVTAKEILKWSEVALLVPIALGLLTNLARIRALAWCIVAAGTLQAVFGLWQWATLGAEASTGRIFGSFDQPNPFAAYVTVALLLAVALLLFSPDHRERWVMGSASVLLVGAEVVARSRGALLGLGVAAVVIAIVGWQGERLFAWGAAVGLPAVAIAWVTHVIPLSLQHRLLDQVRLDPVAVCNSLNDANFSIMARLAYWQAALRMFAAHPLLGVGGGNYDAAYPPYAIWCWPDPLGHAHNYYLNAMAETGILGLIAFLALTGLSFAAGYRVSRRSRSSGVSPTPETTTTQAATAQPQASPRVARALRALVAPLISEENARRALALGFFAVLIAVATQNLTDDLFVHAMELQFALSLAALARLGVPSRTAA